ncbi:MAG TPA: hypothetical protein VM802_30860 [Chitinophaga sp.]|uniref:hypothetical protein n=1 Tax=Chitinophaga sp. TaxID=1869181 RepID=UPI002B69442D|nr:hypothetical protein [Chitinophaga sp.]HVI49306.1 hypothetical protein [Chitinophaga sp.]
MTKKLLLKTASIGLCLFISLPLFAQYPSEDTIQAPKISYRKVTLPRSRQYDGLPPYKISSIEVVSNVWDTSALGFMQVGMSNKVTGAAPDKRFPEYLQEFVNEGYGSLYTPNEMHLLWIVEDLRIAERTGAMSEKAYVRLKAGAYASTDGVSYKRLLQSDDVRTTGGMDVTHKHKGNIADAFRRLFDASMVACDTVLKDSLAPSLTREAILVLYMKKREIPALKDTSLNDGIYLTFQEFLENKPSITTFEIGEPEKKKKVPAYSVSADGQKTLVPEMWGFVSKGVVFKSVSNGLVPLERNGYGYSLTNYVDASVKRNKAMFTRSLLIGATAGIGGIVGGAIAGAATAKGIITLIETDAFPSLKPKPAATAIDMETGDLIF